MRHVAGSSAKEFRPRRFHFLPLGFRASTLRMCGGFHGIGGHHHHHHRRRRYRRRRHHLLLFFVFFHSTPPHPPPPFSVSPSVPRRRNMAPRQEIRPSTPSLSQQPRVIPLPSPLSLSLYFPDTSLPLPRFFPPSPGASPPRCILNQSLGGNAITRHHDASTIFYFKLLYVLVPPPCLSPIPLVSRRRCAVPSRHPRVMSVPVTPPAPQRCSSVSDPLALSLYGPLLSSAPSVLPRQPGYHHPLARDW